MRAATATMVGASATPTVQQAWDRSLAAYRLAQLLYDADCGFGPLFFAQRAFHDEQARIKAEYGGWDRAKATPDGEARADRAWERLSHAEDATNSAHLYPLWAAMRDLIQTPAPDAAAIGIKVDLIAKEEVWNDRDLEEDCYELIRADVERLRGEA